MTEKELKLAKKNIDTMTHREMAQVYRFAPAGDLRFLDGKLNDYFMEKFKSFGGMTSAISKEIGLVQTEKIRGIFND